MFCEMVPIHFGDRADPLALLWPITPSFERIAGPDAALYVIRLEFSTFLKIYNPHFRRTPDATE